MKFIQCSEMVCSNPVITGSPGHSEGAAATEESL